MHGGAALGLLLMVVLMAVLIKLALMVVFSTALVPITIMNKAG